VGPSVEDLVEPRSDVGQVLADLFDRFPVLRRLRVDTRLETDAPGGEAEDGPRDYKPVSNRESGEHAHAFALTERASAFCAQRAGQT